MSDLISRPYQPDEKVTCYACVFGTPEQHASWCMHRWHDDCTCFLPIIEESRGEKHSPECPRSKKAEAA
jgi:hypothetical protein